MKPLNVSAVHLIDVGGIGRNGDSCNADNNNANLADSDQGAAGLLERARSVAASVADPELPFLTVADLGILRSVQMQGDELVARVSPTYSGCPAVAVIEQSILEALRDAGFNARVERVMSPAWSTDWITETGRQKLQQNGIAAPLGNSSDKPAFFEKPSVACPLCGSVKTARVSEFGSTPCKAQYRCNDCREPFDYFKCL